MYVDKFSSYDTGDFILYCLNSYDKIKYLTESNCFEYELYTEL